MSCIIRIDQAHEVQRLLVIHYPDVQTALRFDTPFQFVVAAILSAQCTDVRVNEVTGHLFNKYKTVDDFAHISQQELIGHIKSCGLYKNKSKNIIACAQAIKQCHNGIIPQTRQSLESLPGIGRKTANVVMATIYNEPAVAVDTHVFRVARRIGLSDGATPYDVENDLMDTFDQSVWIRLHHQLIWHGRRICKARNPECEVCPVSHLCGYYAKHASHDA